MGSVGNKYRVHEVAKDFGVPTKQITEILTKYAETPKNHMQVLEDRELSLIFEYLTQHNQVSGIQVIFAEGAKPAEKKQQPAAKPALTGLRHLVVGVRAGVTGVLDDVDQRWIVVLFGDGASLHAVGSFSMREQ